MSVVRDIARQSAIRLQPEQASREHIALDLTALLQRLGLTCVLRSAENLQALAYTDDALAIIKVRGTDAFRRSRCVIAGHDFIIETLVPHSGAPGLDLTPRQAEIVRMIADGHSNRVIAEKLGLSLHTVRRHVEGLLRRLNVSNRAAAAVMLHSQMVPIPRRSPRSAG